MIDNRPSIQPLDSYPFPLNIYWYFNEPRLYDKQTSWYFSFTEDLSAGLYGFLLKVKYDIVQRVYVEFFHIRNFFKVLL